MQKQKKRTTIAVKLSFIVIVMLVISNLISMILLVNRSRVLIRTTVQNGISSLADSMTEVIENEKKLKGNEELSYEEYAEILDGKKLNGVESSYVYVVSSNGTMLYHPTKEKVGEPVENAVVKGLVENIILIGIVVVAFIISTIFGRSIARPLIRLSRQIQKVAGGDLSCVFSNVCRSNDEIALIRDEMQEMTDSLNGIVSKIRESGNTVSANSRELDETSSQTLAANEEISRAVQDVAEGSTNMAGTISDINNR